VTVVLTHLGQGRSRRIDADTLCDGDLEDFAFLILVHILVVVRPELDLIHKAFLDVIEGHNAELLSGCKGEPNHAAPAGTERVPIRIRRFGRSTLTCSPEMGFHLANAFPIISGCFPGSNDSLGKIAPAANTPRNGMLPPAEPTKPDANAHELPRVPGARAALLLLLSINLFNYIDRQVLSAVLPHIKDDFLAADPDAKTKLGALTTAFLVAYMVLSPLFGWLGDRYSRWKLIAVGVIFWSIASGASGLAAGFWILLWTRCFVGVGEAAY